MDVSPETIRTVEFRERLRGYNQDDVDQFLERMAAGVEILQQRLRDATERAARAEERPHEDGDDSLRRTLALAQRTADLAVEEAREQAARLVESAQGEAHAVVSAAQGEANAIVSAAQGEAAALGAEAEAKAARHMEEAQAQALAEVRRLDEIRERLGGEVVSLERHLVEARARAHATLVEAALQLERLVPDPAPAATSSGIETSSAVHAPPAAADVLPAGNAPADGLGATDPSAQEPGSGAPMLSQPEVTDRVPAEGASLQS
jgi:cell division initiation protein